MNNPSLIVVTGGAGFVGSHIVEYLLSLYTSTNIIIFDNFTYAAAEENVKIALMSPRVSLYRGDVADMDACLECLAGAEVVIHLAAESHVDRSFENPIPFVLTNVLGTQCLIEAARKTGVGAFVHCSTDEVYGEVLTGFANEHAPFRPTNPYAASKAAAENILSSYTAAFGMDIRIVRANNIFGTRQNVEKLIPRFTHLAHLNQDITIHGSGSQARSFLSVEDFCMAVSTIIEHGSPSEIYNVGTNDVHTVASLAQKIMELVKPNCSRIINVADRPYNDKAYQIDSTKLRRIGWYPIRTLDVSLPELVAWYRSHQVSSSKVKSVLEERRGTAMHEWTSNRSY